MLEPTNRKEQLICELSTKLDEAKEEIHKYREINTSVKRELFKTGIISLILTSLIVGGGFSLYYGIRQNENYISNEAIYRELEDLKKTVNELEEKCESLSKTQSTITEVCGVIEIEDVDYISEPLDVNWWKERIPQGIDTNRYDCEPDKFKKGSDQYKLQLECYTDSYTGIKVYEKNGVRYFCAAMASAYGIEVGEAWQVTLECGSVFNVVLSDFQQSIIDPDPYYFGEVWLRDMNNNILDILTNYDNEPVCHVLEFVVDMDALNPKVQKAGTMSVLKEFGGLYGNGGNIIEMKYLGKVWNNDGIS